jgi:ribosomal subunit interface protein
MDHSAALEAEVRDRVAKLEEFHDRITACRVVVESPHQRHQQGNLYQVRIYLSVPQHDLVIDRSNLAWKSHEDVHVAIRDAFQAARRQLQDVARKMRGQTKTHAQPVYGHVKSLFPEVHYGFLETADGNEVYFHANALLNIDFDDLQVGDEVHYQEEYGNQGPQAASVTWTGRHHSLT